MHGQASRQTECPHKECCDIQTYTQIYIHVTKIYIYIYSIEYFFITLLYCFIGTKPKATVEWAVSWMFVCERHDQYKCSLNLIHSKYQSLFLDYSLFLGAGGVWTWLYPGLLLINGIIIIITLFTHSFTIEQSCCKE